jgi:hypothetical protein
MQHVANERAFEADERRFIARARGEHIAPGSENIKVIIPSDRHADSIHSYWMSQAPLDSHGQVMALHTRPQNDYDVMNGQSHEKLW